MNYPTNQSSYNHPIPDNEMDRLLGLSELDIDYSDQSDSFKDLAKLAAKVTGTSISLVNLIDSLTQWSISNYGLDIDQMLREDSVCQYTIMETDHFEVEDLREDSRFMNKEFVTGAPKVTYYYGVPLKTSAGMNIGALCVLDQAQIRLDAEQVELLKIIADEIVNRLKSIKVLQSLKTKFLEARQAQRKVAHDIRGPLGGIVGLAQIIKDQGEHNQMDEVLEFVNMIHKSGSSILELAEEILDSQQEEREIRKVELAESGKFDLVIFKEKLEKLYDPQAKHKSIRLEITTSGLTEHIPFTKSKLLQITGNLISNAIKFTPRGGSVSVDLQLLLNPDQPILRILVQDSGVGMNAAEIEAVMNGRSISSEGTIGEQGYGFGLALVNQLVTSLEGTVKVASEPGQGATFQVELPQKLY